MWVTSLDVLEGWRLGTLLVFVFRQQHSSPFYCHRLQRLHQRVEERAASAVAAAAPGAATTSVAVPPAMAEAVAAATREANRAATVSARSEGAVKGLVTRVARLEAAAATGAGQTAQAPLELSQRVNQCEAAMEVCVHQPHPCPIGVI